MMKQTGLFLMAIFLNLLLLLGISRLAVNPPPERLAFAEKPIRLTDAPPMMRRRATEPEPVTPLPPPDEPEPLPAPPPLRPQPEPLTSRPPEMRVDLPRLDVDLSPALAMEPRQTLPPPLPVKPKPAKPKLPVKSAAKPEPAPKMARTAPPAREKVTENVHQGRRTLAQNRPVRPSVFDLEEVDQIPEIVRKIEPSYPFRARRRNISGSVTVKFMVTNKGSVEKPTIMQATPEGIFEESVLKAVTQWRFKPGYYQGTPVATWVVLPIQFNLSG